MYEALFSITVLTKWSR